MKLLKTDVKCLFIVENSKPLQYAIRVTVNSKTHQKILSASYTEKQAMKEVVKFKKELQDPRRPKTKKTIDDIWLEHLNLTRALISEKQFLNKVSIYEKHIVTRFSPKVVTDISYQDCQSWINDLLDSGLKPKTVLNIKNIFQTIIKTAIKLGYIDKNPLYGVVIPKFDNRVYFDMPLSEIKSLVNTIITYREPIYRDLFTFLLHGRRLSEALNLTWDMVDLTNRVYHVPARINKARRNMTYKMTDHLYKIFLDRHLSHSVSVSLSGYVFVNPQTNTKLVDVSKAWKRILISAGVRKIRIHDLRHLVGTYSINELKMSLEFVSQTLGHTDLKTTQKYVTSSAENSKTVIDGLLGSLVNGA